MSRKVQSFASIITQPLNTYNFKVVIPEIDFAEIIQSTNFPSEKLRVITLWTNGEPVRYPALPENSGEWAIKIPESDDGKIRSAFENLKRKMYNQQTGMLIPSIWKNVQIFARDMADNVVFSSVLHGCWLRGRNDVVLDSTNPTANWAWDYVFTYQWIEDIDGNNKGSIKPM